MIFFFVFSPLLYDDVAVVEIEWRIVAVACCIMLSLAAATPLSIFIP